MVPPRRGRRSRVLKGDRDPEIRQANLIGGGGDPWAIDADGGVRALYRLHVAVDRVGGLGPVETSKIESMVGVMTSGAGRHKRIDVGLRIEQHSQSDSLTGRDRLSKVGPILVGRAQDDPSDVALGCHVPDLQALPVAML